MQVYVIILITDPTNILNITGRYRREHTLHKALIVLGECPVMVTHTVVHAY